MKQQGCDQGHRLDGGCKAGIVSRKLSPRSKGGFEECGCGEEGAPLDSMVVQECQRGGIQPGHKPAACKLRDVFVGFASVCFRAEGIANFCEAFRYIPSLTRKSVWQEYELVCDSGLKFR